MVNWTRRERRKTIGGIDFEEMVASQVGEHSHSSDQTEELLTQAPHVYTYGNHCLEVRCVASRRAWVGFSQTILMAVGSGWAWTRQCDNA